MEQIVLATNSAGKVREFQHFFRETSYQIIPQRDICKLEAEETGLTFVENALIKARCLAKHTNYPILADDSGLIVHVLGNSPGLYTARYSGIDADDAKNNRKLLQDLINVKREHRTAQYFCTLVLLKDFVDPNPIICQASWDGEILFEPQHGKHGFGFDPLFFVPTYQCSAAQLGFAVRNKISHRGKALQKLINQL